MIGAFRHFILTLALGIATASAAAAHDGLVGISVGQSARKIIRAGASVNLEVALTTKPDAPVTIAFRLPRGLHGMSVDPPQVAIAPEAWNVARTVKVTLAGGAEETDETNVSIVLSATSADHEFELENVAAVPLQVVAK